MKISYNKNLKNLAKQLRNNSTKSEIKFWKLIKAYKQSGFDFHRQKPCGNYIFDFYCHKLKLVVEIDGYSHTFVEVYKKDLAKEKFIKESGLTLLRFTDNEIMKDIDNVRRAIDNFIDKFNG